MAWTPISGTMTQYQTSTGDLASSYYLKFYQSGTTTAFNMATDSTGGTTLAKCQLDSSGYPTTDGSTRFIPHVNQKYKIVLYKNSTDADANTTGNADWVIDAVDQAAIKAENEIIFETVAAMVADTTLSVGDHVRTLGYTTIGDGGGNEYDVVAAATGTDDGGSYIDLATHQAKGLFPNDYYSVKHFGSVSDGSTDDTAVILVAAAAYKYIHIPYNTKYDPQTLLATLPTDVVIFDASMINSFNSAGETTKEVGLISKDTAASDTHWLIASDHHAILQLSNFGGAGTTSASQRKGSMVWTAGKFENASATNKNGWRGGAIKQFTKESSGSYWIETLRCLAPWAAIGGDYERWKTGESVSSGDYRTNDDQHYVAASTGTTGATGPTHTTGTVSDGGVDWTWIDTADRTIYQIDEYGRFLIGTGSAGSTFRHKVGLTDPVGNYVGQFAARGTSKTVRLAFYPTDGADAEELQPYILAQAGVGLRIFSSTGTEIARFNDDLGTYLKENARSWTMVSDGDTTPSVDGVATIYTQNTGATSITAFDDGDDGQVVDLVIIDANTTLVHSSTFMLAGSVNLTTPAAYTTVTFQKVPSSISNRWIEIGRSEK
jgi:hypothetical protein